MQTLWLGLTKIYNLFHARNLSPEMVAKVSKKDAHTAAAGFEALLELRRLHVALDIAVRDAYGWQGLDLEHNFHEVETPPRERPYSLHDQPRRPPRGAQAPAGREPRPHRDRGEGRGPQVHTRPPQDLGRGRWPWPLRRRVLTRVIGIESRMARESIRRCGAVSTRQLTRYDIHDFCARQPLRRSSTLKGARR